MYWSTLSLFLAGESFAHPVLSWLPFYSWIRLGVHLYLVLPGQQGSVYLYRSYIHPYLEHHERDIDHLITDSHDKAKAAGLQYVKQAIEYVRVNVLKLPPKQPTPPPSRNTSYSQNLLSRFSMPTARAGLTTAGTTDLFSLLGNAVQQVTYPTSRSRDAGLEDLDASGTLIPPHMTGQERSQFIITQRDRLRTLLQAFDNEADATASAETDTPLAMLRSTSRLGSDEGNMAKSKSESEFEDLAYESVPKLEKRPAAGTQRQASWSNWIWGNYGEKNSALTGKKDQ